MELWWRRNEKKSSGLSEFKRVVVAAMAAMAGQRSFSSLFGWSGR